MFHVRDVEQFHALGNQTQRIKSSNIMGPDILCIDGFMHSHTMGDAKSKSFYWKAAFGNLWVNAVKTALQEKGLPTTPADIDKGMISSLFAINFLQTKILFCDGKFDTKRILVDENFNKLPFSDGMFNAFCRKPFDAVALFNVASEKEGCLTRISSIKASGKGVMTFETCSQKTSSPMA